MTVQAGDRLEALIRSCGMGSLIDWYAPPEKALEFLNHVLSAAGAESARRYGPRAFRFSEAELCEEHERAPHRVAALFQALRVSQNPAMLVMAWQMIQGAVVNSLDVEYELDSRFLLRIELSANDDDTECGLYETNNVRDLKLIRHFSMTEVDDRRPRIDGFLPLRLQP
jgi:hypothetical protein